MPIEVVTREGAIHSVIFYGKGGWQVINCQVAVDATGDGDLSDLAGAAELKDGAYHQYSSTVFHLSGVDTSAAEQTDREQLGKIMKEAVRKGDFELPRLDGGITRLPKNGEMRCNLTRVSYEDRPMNPTNALELSYAEAEGRRQAYLYLAFLKQWVPGYKHAYISRLPAHVGVRETRRFKGEYVLTKEDILAAKKFEDGIASYSWPVEVHKKGRETIWEAVPEGEHYEIPLRSLIAESLDNLFIPGRCFSATQEAHASARTAAGCLAMGEAAGVTAGTASARDKRVKEIPYDEIVNKLKAYGACLE